MHPCLVITGPASEGNRVLHLLKNFCRGAVLVAGFSRSHLSVIYGRLTLLISEPNLDKKTATLLSGLTDTNYLVLGAGRLRGLGGPIGIYAGEDPETHDILNSIHIHLTAAKARPSTTSCKRLEEMIRWIPVHLTQYRDKNLNHVERYTWNLTADVPSEMAAVTKELGRCIVEGVELYRKLVDLLKIQHHEHISDRSSTAEAAVLEASLNLGHQGKEQMLVAEIAAELNRILKERGERLIYSAEKIGHQLKKLGLSTRRLGKAGKGLIMDKATIALLHELAGTYGGAGLTPDDDNLHCPLCTESK